MSGGVHLRHATADDVDALITFWAVAGENDSRPKDTAQAVLQLLSRDPESVLIAHDDGEIVGSVIAGWDGWRAHLYRLAVSPERRREGIGRRLLVAAEARLTTMGATRVDAMVLVTNELARHTWRGAGYAPQQVWARWVKPTTEEDT